MDIQTFFTSPQFTRLIKEIKEMVRYEVKKELSVYRPAVIEEWVSVKEAKVLLCCGTTKLWELRKARIIKTTKNGRKVLVSTKSIKEYLCQ